MDHGYLDFPNPQWYPTEDTSVLAHSNFLFDIDLPVFPPPTTTQEGSTMPSLPYLPTPDLPLEGLSSTQQTPLPTPPVPVRQPTPNEIRRFEYCPYTKNGKICGIASWIGSGTKAIERHMKQTHFKPGSTAAAWICPNSGCKRNGKPFPRKDAITSHRKKCDQRHAMRNPGYTPLPHVERGSDRVVKRWMVAGREQRNAIRDQLRAGTPWSKDLLQPIYL